MFVTRCDRCGKERRTGKNQGWATVSVYTRSNRDDLHVDLCPTCATEMLVVLKIQQAQPGEIIGESPLHDLT